MTDDEQKEIEQEIDFIVSEAQKLSGKCLSLVNDQFVQQYHDKPDALVEIIKEAKTDDPYTGVSGGTKIANLVITICERYLADDYRKLLDNQKH